MIDKITHLLCELYFDAGMSTVRAATSQWYSKASDSIGVVEYAGRITQEPTFAIRVSCVLWSDKTSVSIGAIELANTDGEYTYLLSLQTRDSCAILKLVDDGDGYDESVTVADCIVDSVEDTGATIRVNLRGQDTRLDRPLQPELFDSSVSNPQLENTPLPITIGQCIQVEPPQINPTTLTYQLADTGITSLDALYSGGALFDVSQYALSGNDTGVTASVTPAARVTADLLGTHSHQLDRLGGIGDFIDPSIWTGNDLDDWTETQSPPNSSISFVPGGGLRMIWNSANIAAITSGSVLPDTAAGWYLISIRIPYVDSSVGVDFAFRNATVAKRISKPGDYCFPIYVPAGMNQNVTISSTTGNSGEVIIESVYLYKYPATPITSTSLWQLLWDLLTRGGLNEKNLDFDEVIPANISSLLSRTVGFHSLDNKTAKQAIEYVMQAMTGWFFVGPDGLARLGTFRDISGTPDLVVSELNMTSWPTSQADAAPGLSDTYAAEQVWAPYTDQELAGITYPDRPPFMADYRSKMLGANTLGRFYRHGVGAPAIGTVLTSPAAAQAEADRVTLEYSSQSRGQEQQKRFFVFDVAFPSAQQAAALFPNKIIRLDHEAFGDFDGQNALLVGVAGQYRTNTLRITVRV